MPAKQTVTILLHGANQAYDDEVEPPRLRTSEDNTQKWNTALDVSERSRWVRALISGEHNGEVAEYHGRNHTGRDYPAYTRYECPWYGSVWQEQGPQLTEARLNPSNDKDLSDIVVAGGMKKHFDELVPFYELQMTDSGKTLYEHVCRTFLDGLDEAIGDASHYVVIAHSMGCAVSYNVLTHISCAAAEPKRQYAEKFPDCLSQDYRDAVDRFVEKGKTCFALMTFGNYTAYDYCQKLNNNLLFGSMKEAFAYPDAVGRWYNFWTRGLGDPYIIDDKIKEDMVDIDENRFDDVKILTKTKGHGARTWFDRERFSERLRDRLARHLYL